MIFTKRCFKICLIALGISLLAQVGFAQVRPMLINMVGARCSGMQQMSPEECQATRTMALDTNCINRDEYNWARTKAYSVFCAGTQPIMVCPCSCFDATTQIMTNSQNSPVWMDASKVTAQDKLVTLSDDATLSGLSDTDNSLTTRDLVWTTFGPEEPDLYVFELSTGRELVVTTHHALLLSNGVVKAAKDIAATDKLVKYNGDIVDILSVSRRPATDGNVYNFLVDGNTKESHLIVAEEVIVGDTVWQDTYGNFLNEVIIRQ